MENDKFYMYDLREPKKNLMKPNASKLKNGDDFKEKEDWSKIPFYPTFEKKQMMISQYGEELARKIIEHSYIHSVDPTLEVIPEITQNNRPSPKINNFIPRQQQIQLKKSANIRLGGLY
jgi:hypothetical protein